MSQILKPEVKDRIQKNALDEFVQYGYNSTTMKSIAQKSQIAVGNIYNYFKDKEALYDSLVQPVFTAINDLFNEPLDRASIGIIETRINTFIDIYKSNKKTFMMLLENSNDTKFETLKDRIIENFASAIIRYKNKMIEKPRNNDNIFIKAFTGAYINGIITILSHDIDEHIKLERLYEFLSFMKDSLMHKFLRETGEIK